MMKIQTLLVLNLCLVAFHALAQQVRTVSNNPKIPAQYQQIKLALQEAQPGDTLYVHPSETLYDANDSLVITKPVVIIGGGFANTSADYGGLNTRFNNLVFTGGADGSAVVNCRIGRLRFHSAVSADKELENFTAHHNYIDRVDFQAIGQAFLSKKLVIRNNIIPLIAFINWIQIGSGADIRIENNILGQVANGGGANLKISNNLFSPGMFGRTALVQLYDASVFNNIFWGDSLLNGIGANSCRNTIFDHNLAFRTNDGFSLVNENIIGTNNITGNQNPQFVSTPRTFVNLAQIMQGNFQLRQESVARGRGTLGTDIGITGGQFPFDHRQRVNFPHIRSIRVNNPVLGENNILRFVISAEVTN